jgi:predicted 3-demethylubiquinone-9 3-methyltransferase (glyoxalase superfamily)
MSNPIFPCLWFDGKAKEAAEFYCTVFKNAKITSENPVVVMFDVDGTKFMCLNGGPHYTFNEAVSFVITCDTQNEIDDYWEKLTVNGGEEGKCGWLKDKFGVSWQVVPSAMGKIMSSPEKAQRVMPVLMQMKKLDIDKLEQAAHS